MAAIGSQAWIARIAAATSARAAGARRSASLIGSPATKRVTRQGGWVSSAATSGATPAAAARSAASRSAPRSIPSSPVSLPGIRTT